MDDLQNPPRANSSQAEWVALGFAIIFPSFATWLYFTWLGGHPSSRAAFAITKVVQFTFPVAWMIWICRGWRPHFSAPRARDLLAGAAFGLAVTLGGLACYYGLLRGGPLLGTAPRELTGKLSGFGIRTGGQFLALAMFYSLVHSLLEEYYWRWFVFGRLRRHVTLATAIAISSLGFMAHHVLLIGHFLQGYGPATWLFSAAIAIGGAVWAWQYHRTGALYTSWAGHLVIDAGLMWIGYDLWKS